MLMNEESTRVRKIVTDSLAELLVNCLKFKAQFTVEALFAITLDSAQEFHFTVNENVEVDLRNQTESGTGPDLPSCTNEHRKNQSDLIGPKSEPMSMEDEFCIVQDLKKSKVNFGKTQMICQEIKEEEAPADEEGTPKVINIVPESCDWTDTGNQPNGTSDNYDLPLELSVQVPPDDIAVDEKPACTDGQLARTDLPARRDNEPGNVEVTNGGVPCGKSSLAPNKMLPDLLLLDMDHSKSTANPGKAAGKKSSSTLIRSLLQSSEPKLPHHTTHKHGLPAVRRPDIGSAKAGVALGPRGFQQSRSHTIFSHLVQVESPAGKKIVGIVKVPTSIPVSPHPSKVAPLDIKPGVSLLKHKSKESLIQAVQTVNPSPKATPHDQPNFEEVLQITNPKNAGRKSIPTTDDRVAQKILLSKGPMVSVPRIQHLFRCGRRPCSAQVKRVMKKLAAEQFGRMNYDKICTNRGNSTAFVFYKKNPTELTFPLAEYEVSKEEYVENFYDSYSQGWDPDKHKGEPKCSSWS